MLFISYSEKGEVGVYKFLMRCLTFFMTGFILLAEGNLDLMCTGFMDEIEIPEELIGKELLK